MPLFWKLLFITFCKSIEPLNTRNNHILTLSIWISGAKKILRLNTDFNRHIVVPLKYFMKNGTLKKSTSLCVSGASCKNTVGSFTCTCGLMHTGDGLVSGSGCVPVSNNPCPSTACWDWDGSTGTCSLKAGTNCAQVTCNHNTADISFVSELYGVSDNQTPNPFGPLGSEPWEFFFPET